MVSRRTVLASSIAAASVLASCTRNTQQPELIQQTSPELTAQTLNFRLWDQEAALAYEKSFAAFTENFGIEVNIEIINWNDYWQTLPLDLSVPDSPSAPDVFWLNSASFTQLQQAGYLVNITKELNPDTSLWQSSVVDLYSREGALWGVPQIWDSIALFYNKTLLDEAGIDPEALAFNPSLETDPLKEAAKILIRDFEGRRFDEEGFVADNLSIYGFNSQVDRQAIIGPFLASNGAEFQNAEGRFAFNTPEGIAAIQYLVELIQQAKVAPSAADTNASSRYTRDLFIQGKLALYQSGPYSVKPIFEGVENKFEWAIAPLIKGPSGGKSVVHGVIAAGNANSSKKEKIYKLLNWLGGIEGQSQLGTEGISFPSQRDATHTFVDYWAQLGVDVQQFISATNDPAPADLGPKAVAGLNAVMPVFERIFAGEIPVAEGLRIAQDAGNEAMA